MNPVLKQLMPPFAAITVTAPARFYVLLHYVNVLTQQNFGSFARNHKSNGETAELPCYPSNPIPNNPYP